MLENVFRHVHHIITQVQMFAMNALASVESVQAQKLTAQVVMMITNYMNMIVIQHAHHTLTKKKRSASIVLVIVNSAQILSHAQLASLVSNFITTDVMIYVLKEHMILLAVIATIV